MARFVAPFAPTSATSSSSEKPYPDRPSCLWTNHTNGSRLSTLYVAELLLICWPVLEPSSDGSGYHFPLSSCNALLVKSETPRRMDLILSRRVVEMPK